MPTTSYFVPRPDWDQIGLILSVDSAQLKKLADSVQLLDPSRTSAGLVSALPDTFGLDKGLVEDVIEFSKRMVMFAWLQGDTIPELFEGIADFFDSTNFDKWNRPEWENRRSAMEILLSASGPVFVMAKAEALTREYGNLLLNSRLVSDARYVFDDPGEAIIAGAVTQTLIIEYLDSDYSRKRAFFALDVSDIEVLLKQLKRAHNKQSAIAATFVSSGIKDLTV